AFAQFFNGDASREIFDAYRKAFIPTEFMEYPNISVSYAATVAETEEEAEYRARPIDLFRLGLHTGRLVPIVSAEKAKDIQLSEKEEMAIRHQRKLHLVGTPDQVAGKMMQDKEAFGFEEIIINANHAEFTSRMHTYRLLKEAWQSTIIIDFYIEKSISHNDTNKELLSNYYDALFVCIYHRS